MTASADLMLLPISIAKYFGRILIIFYILICFCIAFIIHPPQHLFRKSFYYLDEIYFDPYRINIQKVAIWNLTNWELIEDFTKMFVFCV